MAINKDRTGLFSVAINKEHIARINELVKNELPESASRNAFFGAICAVITPDEARNFYERALSAGAVGPNPENKKKRQLAAELVTSGVSIEELQQMIAERKAKKA